MTAKSFLSVISIFNLIKNFKPKTIPVARGRSRPFFSKENRLTRRRVHILESKEDPPRPPTRKNSVVNRLRNRKKKSCFWKNKKMKNAFLDENTLENSQELFFVCLFAKKKSPEFLLAFKSEYNLNNFV